MIILKTKYHRPFLNFEEHIALIAKKKRHLLILQPIVSLSLHLTGTNIKKKDKTSNKSTAKAFSMFVTRNGTQNL